MWCLQVAQFVQRTVQNQIFLLEKNPLHIFKSLCVCETCISLTTWLKVYKLCTPAKSQMFILLNTGNLIKILLSPGLLSE